MRVYHNQLGQSIFLVLSPIPLFQHNNSSSLTSYSLSDLSAQVKHHRFYYLAGFLFYAVGKVSKGLMESNERHGFDYMNCSFVVVWY